MTEIVKTCVNHPDIETRISCSSCGDPICTRCMRTAAVGQKCPSCARSPRSTRALGKPQHYLRVLGAGLPAALVGGFVYGLLVRGVRIGGLILAGVLGFMIGRVVRWGARGQTQQPFRGIAMTLAGLAVAVAFLTAFRTLFPSGGLVLLAYGVAVWLSLRGLQG